MKRFRPLVLPGFLVLISIWLVYDHWINPDPHWRWPKAEAAGPIGLLIGVPYLLYSFYRVARPYQLAVGMRVMFARGEGYLTGVITEMQGDQIKVRTEEGTFEMDRYAVEGTVWAPATGERVRVRWSDGALYPAVVQQINVDQVQVRFDDGRELAVPMAQVAKA